MSATTAITAVIFDMDGVLTDSEPIINEAAVTMFRELGCVVAPEDFRPFVGTGEDRYLSGVAEKHGIPLDLPAAKRRTYEIYLALVPEKLRAFPGAPELVQACRRAGLRVAVASSADRIKIDANLNQIGLPAPNWDVVISGEDVERKKPAPDIFLIAAQRLGLAPETCVVIEDAVNGVAAAKSAGMRCVAVAQTFPSSQLTAADLVCPAIHDVSIAKLTGDPSGSDGSMTPKPPLASTVPPLASPPESQPISAMETSAGIRGIVKPWGFWMTLGSSIVIAAAFLGAQVIGLLVGSKIEVALGIPSGEILPRTTFTGNNLCWATLVSTPMLIGLSWGFAAIRAWQRGFRTADYLGIISVSARTWGLCLLAFLGLLGAAHGVGVLLNRPEVPDVQLDMYRTAGSLPLLWFVVVIVGPLGEEFFLRGFMLPGFNTTWLGSFVGVPLTSLLWAATHLQYDFVGVAIIFGCGLLIGAVRVRTGSLLPCIMMHSAMNLIALIQTAMIARNLPPGG